MKYLFLLLILYATTLPVQAQHNVVYEPADKEVVARIVSQRDSLRNLSLPERMVAIARQFQGTPYQAKTLEITPEKEQMVINLRAFDCTTFVESMLALAQLIGAERQDFETYTNLLATIRYYKSNSSSYPARLHYFTDWMYRKSLPGDLQLISQKLGGKPYVKSINFMSTHPAAYPQLADKNNVAAIQKIEKDLNTRPLFYIPKADLATLEKGIQTGDIIAITTSIAGLDVVHTGMAVRQNNRIYLLHASSDQQKVAISKMPLADYLKGNKTQTGIMVARLQDQKWMKTNGQ